MAFVTPKDTNTASNNGQTREKRTAIGFINLYVPLKDGTRMKLAGDLTLRLYAENQLDVQLMERIKAGTITPEQLKELIQVEISVARDKDAPIELAL